jgi:hypothetical protein
MSNGGRDFWRGLCQDGVIVGEHDPAVPGPFAVKISSIELPGLLDQLLDDGYAAPASPAGALIPWDQVYPLLEDANYASSIRLLQLPPIAEIAPRLQSHGSLTDTSFQIRIAGWIGADRCPVHILAIQGAALNAGGQIKLLSAPVWKLVQLVGAFHRRADADRNDIFHRQQWGIIRRAALEAKSELGDFLLRTVVLTPEKLKLEFRKTEERGTTVVEVTPRFEGALEGWLAAFDRALAVRERYDIPTPQGVVQIMTTPAIRSVLGEIKRMPGRRIAGPRAEAFLLNPYSALGPEATAVIDEKQLTEAKTEAGIAFEKFRPHIATNTLGYPFEVGIEIDEANGTQTRHIFVDDTELKTFVAGLEQRLQRGHQLFGWNGYQFELIGDAPDNLTRLKKALDERTKQAILISGDRIYYLSQYSDRVSDIGEDRPYASPYIIKKKDEDRWLPENLLIGLSLPPHEELIPLTRKQYEEFKKSVENAVERGDQTVEVPGTAQHVPMKEAQKAVEAIDSGISGPQPPRAPKELQSGEGSPSSSKRKSLIIRGNIDALEHHETAAAVDPNGPKTMERPAALKLDVDLRAHQIAGVGRMQQLFAVSPDRCRGLLLADDMGLGKTIQLLTLMAWAFEKHPDLPPALVVAPVSLLDNWREEIDRFFKPGSLRVLTEYGNGLAALRVPRDSIDEQLKSDGLVRFLKPGWRGNAQIVLTTYETLRDLEFSFALELWSIMVCDEAQKIKNPNAMVTRAAKKQNVRFRIACTGTPVENSLADLWCLYDFVQPGLLGALNDFGRQYGRPIEQLEVEGKTKLEELRKTIEPRLIRRTKRDVAKDLPEKIEVDCKVPFSNEQRGLYLRAFELSGKATGPESSDLRVHRLTLLQHLRLICADPRQYGVECFVPEEPGEYRRKAPKMDWLLRTLRSIKEREEKALIFAEHRDIQRLLQHYVAVEFGVRPDIVNGDTTVSSKAEANRQKRIKAFQAAPGFGVIILSLLAVGFGVNIQAANHVIHYLRHWNPAKEDQATDRAYRIGQTKPVHVYCPLTVAADFKTFDVKLDELLQRRRALATDMLHGNGSLSAADFDIRDLVPPGGPPIRDVPITPQLVERMDANFFEAFVAALWRKQGYEYVHVTPQSDDGGVDVVAIRGTEGVLIQCKSSGREGAQLGWDAIKEVVGGTAIYAERYPGVRFKRICVTNQRFNTTAYERARANDVEIFEQDRLFDLLARHPVTTLDVFSRL